MQAFFSQIPLTVIEAANCIVFPVNTQRCKKLTTTDHFFIRQIGTYDYRVGPSRSFNKVMADRRASLDEQRDVRFLPLLGRRFESRLSCSLDS